MTAPEIYPPRPGRHNGPLARTKHVPLECLSCTRNALRYVHALMGHNRLVLRMDDLIVGADT